MDTRDPVCSHSHSGLNRERRTMAKMIGVYCRGRHGTNGSLCVECQELLDYAHLRLEKCPFGERKPTCAKCPIHCYQPKRRERVRAVMRYAGPRLLFRHPIFTVRHWLDGLAAVPPHPKQKPASGSE